MKAFASGLRRLGRDKERVMPASPVPDDRLVVAHFMLGNTYPFSRKDWDSSFALAEETGLDGFALNLGHEDWQLQQALSGFDVLVARRTGQDPDAPPTPPPSAGSSTSSARPFQMFLSMDMMVLPSVTREDADALSDKVIAVMRNPDYLRFRGKKVLSTFGGQDASFGGMGWAAWLQLLQRDLGEEICFWPAFFLPPETILDLPYVDAAFMWNGGWPLQNHPLDLKEDELFLAHRKPYMAAVSPCFFTHYGTEGEWAYNKNWIFRSDDLLLPTRFQELLDLPPERSPQIIQVISWNDGGESHAIAPPLGGQPGCSAWTDDMDHVAFREMVLYFADRWRRGRSSRGRDGEAEVPIDRVQVWAWYRTHPAQVIATKDPTGRPKNADWAQDLLNFVVLAPPDQQLQLVVHNARTDARPLAAGKLNALTIPFIPGEVSFEVIDQKGGGVLLRGDGRTIKAEVDRYNYNFWTGSWSASLAP